jgi:hypothetical protein
MLLSQRTLQSITIVYSQSSSQEPLTNYCSGSADQRQNARNIALHVHEEAGFENN